MTIIIFYGLLYAGLLIISETYGEINTTLMVPELHSTGNQYFNESMKLTKLPKRRNFILNELSQSLDLDQTSSNFNNSQKITLKLYSDQIISNKLRNVFHAPLRSLLNDKVLPNQYESNLGSNNYLNQNIQYFNNTYENNSYHLENENKTNIFKRDTTYLHRKIINKVNITKHYDGNGGYKNVIVRTTECCINNNCRTLKKGEVCDFHTDNKAINEKGEKLSVSLNKPSKSTNNKVQKHGDKKENFNGKTNTTKLSPKNVPKNNNPYVKTVGVNENEVKDIRNHVLEKSNYFRKKHNIIPLTMDEKMNNYAQDWANRLAMTGNFHHRKDNIYGENLYASSSSKDLGKKAVDSWYNEIIYYDVNANENQLFANKAIHHMTQLLWKSSKKLGVGISKDRNGMYNVVANYDPFGNLRRHFKDNLPSLTNNKFQKKKNTYKT